MSRAPVFFSTDCGFSYASLPKPQTIRWSSEPTINVFSEANQRILLTYRLQDESCLMAPTKKPGKKRAKSPAKTAAAKSSVRGTSQELSVKDSFPRSNAGTIF